MKVSLFGIVASLALSVATAKRFTAGGAAGRRLLREAVVIENKEQDPDARELQEDELDLGAMYIEFEGCSSYQDHGQDYKDYWENYNANKNYNKYNNANANANYDAANENYNNRELANYDNYNMWNENLNTVNLVRFRLCWDASCGYCMKNRAYAVDMVTFLLAYNEHLQYVEEKECEQIRQECYCKDNNNNGNNYYQSCWNSCYKQAHKYSCIVYNDNGNNEQFDLEQYLMCNEMDYYPSGYANYQINKNGQGAGYYNDPDNAYDNGVYYVGPYCKDWSGIYLGTFLENTCSLAAAHATFKSNYLGKNGETFPYFSRPIIEAGACLSCEDEDEYYENEEKAEQKYYEQQQKYQMQQQYQQYGGNQQYGQYAYYQEGAEAEEEEEEEQEKQVNDMCAFAQDDGDDDVISCVYGDGNNGEGNYDGCYFLEMLKELDGRNSRSIWNANNKLQLQKNYSVILGVLAVVLMSVIGALCFCDPTSIDEKKSALLHDAGPDAPSDMATAEVKVQSATVA